MKLIDKCDAIKTDQDVIDLDKLIQTNFHLQKYYKQGVMATVEINKRVYLFYRGSYQSNSKYLESFKAHLKVIESHNGSVVYHTVLAAVSIQENHNITST